MEVSWMVFIWSKQALIDFIFLESIYTPSGFLKIFSFFRGVWNETNDPSLLLKSRLIDDANILIYI